MIGSVIATGIPSQSDRSQRSKMGKTAPPRRLSRLAAGQTRDYLTPQEVERLQKAASNEGRHGHRDATIILVMFRHGLRVSEAAALHWDDIDLKRGRVHVRRLKGSEDAVHPLCGPELRALRQLQRDYPDTPYVFSTERGGPITPATIRKMVARAGKCAGIRFHVNPHMLRHATGYKLANAGVDTRTLQAYLGHTNIQNTVKYTKLNSGRFKGLWRD